MTDNQKPEEPDFNKFEEELGLSPLDEDAFQMFELFNSLLRAGFRERQALTLVAMIVNDANESEFLYSSIDDDDDEEGLSKDEQ
jgi:hypothetical protein